MEVVVLSSSALRAHRRWYSIRFSELQRGRGLGAALARHGTPMAGHVAGSIGSVPCWVSFLYSECTASSVGKNMSYIIGE